MDTIKIVAVNLYNVSCGLRKPFTSRGVVTSQRHSILVQFIGDNGEMGFGEASPLEGFSPESLKKARHQMSLLAKEWKNRNVPCKGEELVLFLRSAFDRTVNASSVIFAFESAAITMVARFKNVAPCEILHAGSTRSVPSAGLLQGSVSEVVDEARLLKSRGYSVFKLKVGSRNIPLDVQKVEETKLAIGPQGRLRLDADRSWHFDEALLFAQNIGKNQIEFIEDPCLSQDQWNRFVRLSDIPVAADEFLSGTDNLSRKNMETIPYLIIKPTVCGGVIAALQLMKKAAQNGQKVIISSSFESGVGLRMLANLGCLSGQAAGLGTSEWLQQDILSQPLVASGGIITVPALALNVDLFRTDIKASLATF
jgi:O-succinylbenzoate synthase